MLDPSTLAALGASAPWALGRGVSLGLLSQAHALTHPSSTAVIDKQGPLTWGEVDRRANSLARFLESNGVSEPGGVATLLRNGREALETFIAAQKLGSTFRPLNTWAKGDELAGLIKAANPSVIVFDARHFPPESLAKNALRILVGSGESGVPYEGLVAGDTRPPIPFIGGKGEGRVVINTSGTTGAPKGAFRDPAAAGVNALAALLTIVPFEKKDTLLCPAPIFHSFGIGCVTIAVVMGATVVLPDVFDPTEFFESIEQHRVTAAAVTPLMLHRLLESSDSAVGLDLSSLRILVCSGSLLTDEVRAKTMDLFGPVLYDLYGSTEAGWISIATPSDIGTRPGTVGKPVPGVEVKILNDSGEQAEPGEVGEIHVQSNVEFAGYTTGQARRGPEGLMPLGDLGVFDADGFLFVKGRADDLVVIGGENVFPSEIERVISLLPGVREVAVVGVPDEEYGQVLAAFVEGDVTKGEVLEKCRQGLSSFKVPRHVEIVDSIPSTPSGKLLKR
ncbi:MAG TPA: AMP-binding protein, partial [Actinomycetota bacterium]|nr:AMP-binding protein [Actinomycetota bacterium]